MYDINSEWSWGWISRPPPIENAFLKKKTRISSCQNQDQPPLLLACLCAKVDARVDEEKSAATFTPKKHTSIIKEARTLLYTSSAVCKMLSKLWSGNISRRGESNTPNTKYNSVVRMYDMPVPGIIPGTYRTVCTYSYVRVNNNFSNTHVVHLK